jgi:hypothetical protein
MIEMMAAIFLKGFVLLAVFGLVVLPIEMLLKRYLPEGRLKRVLFFRWSV